MLAVENEREGPGAWAHSLTVTAMTECGGALQATNIARGRDLFALPEWVDSGFGLFYLPFHFDLCSVLPYPLQ